MLPRQKVLLLPTQWRAVCRVSSCALQGCVWTFTKAWRLLQTGCTKSNKEGGAGWLLNMQPWRMGNQHQALTANPCRGPPYPTRVCRNYVTPRSFLDLLGQYTHLLHASRTELGDKRRRLLDGIAKLNETSSTLTAMRSQLNELQPLLAEKTAATSTLLQQVWGSAC